MKILNNIAGALLGLLFIFVGLLVLSGKAPNPDFPPDSAPAHFKAAFGPTGYMTFIKVLEVVGGILVAIPLTRNFGLLILGPIIVNIVAYHIFIFKGAGMTQPMFIVVVVLPAYLLWAERQKFLGLLHTSNKPSA